VDVSSSVVARMCADVRGRGDARRRCVRAREEGRRSRARARTVRWWRLWIGSRDEGVDNVDGTPRARAMGDASRLCILTVRARV